MRKQITISSFEFYRVITAALAIGAGAGFSAGMLLGVLDKVIR